MRKGAIVLAAVLVGSGCGKGEPRSALHAPIGADPAPSPHLRFLGEEEPDPNATVLKLAVAAQHCIGEAQAVVGDVDVAEAPDTVTVTAHLAARDTSIERCTGGVELYAPVTVTLAAPLAGRRVLDGSCTPPVEVVRQFENREPCTPSDQEKAEQDAVGAWSTFDAGPLSPRGEPKGVWDGTEMILVGGLAIEQYRALSDGAAYNPTTKTWRRIPDLPTPGRVFAVAPTADGLLALSQPGTDLSVFKGTNAHVYSSTTNAWRAAPPPAAYTYPHAFWTGTENLVWGAEGGAAFDPRTDTWRQIPPVGLAGATTSGLATGNVAQWIGATGVLAVLGAYDPRDGSPPHDALYLFSPATNRWRKAADPPASVGHGGSFVVGASEIFDSVDQPGQHPLVYNAKTDAWHETDSLDAERDGGTAYFTGVDLGDGRGVVRAAITATPLLLVGEASGRWDHAASPGRLPAPDAVLVWTGASALLWGRPTPIAPGDRNAAFAWTPPAKG